MTVLQNYGASIANSKCQMCDIEEETVNHVFLECEVARFIWGRIGLWWKEAIPVFMSLIEMWCWIESISFPPRFRNHFKVVVTASLKSLWDARNERVFKQNIKPQEVIFKGAQDMAYNWLYSRDSKFSCDRITWFRNPLINN